MTSKRIPYLDGWRGLAIIVVLLSHFVAAFDGRGTLGVELFFVLSGYLLAGQLFTEHIPLVFFFKRRFSRVYPALFLFVIAMVGYAKYCQDPSYDISWYELFCTLTFLRTYLPINNSIWSDLWPIGHIWSLNVEEHSYLWLGMGVILCRFIRKPNAELVFLFSSVFLSGFFILLYADYSDLDDQSPWHIHSECASFSIFASAAYRVARHRSKFLQTRPPKYVALVALSLGIYFYSEKDFLGVIGLVTPLCLAIAVNHLGDLYGWLLKVLSSPLLRWYGACSFSVYLWQQLFYIATITHTPWVFVLWKGLFFIAVSCHLPWASELPGYVMIVITTMVGASSFYLIERPSRSYLNKIWGKPLVET